MQFEFSEYDHSSLIIDNNIKHDIEHRPNIHWSMLSQSYPLTYIMSSYVHRISFDELQIFGHANLAIEYYKLHSVNKNGYIMKSTLTGNTVYSTNIVSIQYNAFY